MAIKLIGGTSGIPLETTALGEALVFIPQTQQVVSRDVYSEIAQGLIAGQVSESMAGYNLAVGTTFEPLTVASGATYPIVNTPTVLTISSDATTDVFGTGTGAWKVLVQGVTTGFVEASEMVQLNGRNPINTVNTYLAINHLTVVAAGTNLSNNGAIYAGFGTVTTGVPASVLCAIAINENTSQNCVLTVPAGKTWEVKMFSISSNGAGFVQLRTRTNLGLIYFDNTLPISAGYGVLPSFVPKVIPEKTQVQLWCRGVAAISVGAVLQGVLRDN